MHSHTIVMYIQYKFNEIPSIGYLVIAEDVKSLKFSKSKGNNSAITHDYPIILHVHNITMVIYIQYKFHDFLSIGYFVMAEEGKKDG